MKAAGYDSTALARWNAANYSGFFFDPKDMLGNEALVLYSVDGRMVSPTNQSSSKTIPFSKGFQYTTMLEPRNLILALGEYYVSVS